MKTLLSILFLFLHLLLIAQQPYRFTKGKAAGIGTICLASFVDGFVEGYEFDGRTYFERKFGLSPKSRFGSRSWERRYTNPNFWNQNMGVFDFYHVGDDTRKVLYISGSITLGISSYRQNKTIKHYLIDAGIMLLASSISKSLGMRIVRHK